MPVSGVRAAIFVLRVTDRPLGTQRLRPQLQGSRGDLVLFPDQVEGHRFRRIYAISGRDVSERTP